MTINDINNTMPKTAARTKDFEAYISKSGFVADCKVVPLETRETIKNELANIIKIEVHNSGKYIAATLYFGGKEIDKAERYRYVVIDLTGDEIDCELAGSIKEAKAAIRAKVGAQVAEESAKKQPVAAKAVKEAKAAEKPKVRAGEKRTTEIINKVEAAEDAKKAAAKNSKSKAG